MTRSNHETVTQSRESRKWSQSLTRAIASILALSGTASVNAQMLEDIVVTARKVEQNLQDVPLTVTALGAAQIERRGMDDWRDWADFVPSLHISSPPNGDRNGINPVIRGIINTNHSSANVSFASATTSLMIGDVPIFGVDPRLPDIARIEVVRGPQGTLYGAAAMGGVIRYIPNAANWDRFEAKVSGGWGMVNEGGNDVDASAFINVPLIAETLALRAVAYYREEAGFVDVRIRGLSEIGTVETTPQFALVTGATDFFDVRECKTSVKQTGGTPACVKDANEATISGMRITATYAPHERVQLRPTFMHQERELGHNNNVDGNDPLDRYAERFMTLPSSEGFDFISLDGEVDLGPVDLIYVGGRLRRDYGVISDFTYGIFGDKNNRPLIPGEPRMTVIPAPMPLNYENDSTTRTHEVRLSRAGIPLGSLFGSSVKLDVLVGYFKAKDERDTLLDSKNPAWNLAAPAAYQMLADGCYTCSDTRVVYTDDSFFGDVTLHLTDRLSIGGGARHFDQKLTQLTTQYGDSGNILTPRVTLDTTGRNPGAPGSFPPVQESGTKGRAGLQFRIAGENLLFYNYGEGFRLGLFQNPTGLNTATPQCRELAERLGVADSQVDSDEVKSHEVGLKSVWKDSRLVVNPSVFYTKWSDLQQSVILTSIDSTCPQVLSGNIGEAEIKGAELEVGLFLDSLTMNAGVSYVDAAISSAPPGAPGQEGDLIAGVPEWSASLSAEYSFPLAFATEWKGFVRADWRYVDERQLNFGRPENQNPLTISKSYNIGNIRIGGENDIWEAALYLDNVTDAEVSYSSRIVTGVNWAEDRSVNRPRTVGMFVSRRF